MTNGVSNGESKTVPSVYTTDSSSNDSSHIKPTTMCSILMRSINLMWTYARAFYLHITHNYIYCTLRLELKRIIIKTRDYAETQ